MAKEMFTKFALSNQEFEVLLKKFHDLARFQAWQLLRRNTHNNHTDELEDIEQDLLIAVVKAGVYYKRQLYIEECLELSKEYAQDEFVKSLIFNLEDLWKDRTKHGAGRQKFGEHQEKILDTLVAKIIPEPKRPSTQKTLQVDNKFSTYCKQITWNQQKNLGRKITRERSVRNGSVSLNEFSYMGGSESYDEE